MSSLQLGQCMRMKCDASTAGGDDAFCQACWKRLGREQRTFLVRLRNDARRSKGATSKTLVLAILRAAKWLDDQDAKLERERLSAGDRRDWDECDRLEPETAPQPQVGE